MNHFSLTRYAGALRRALLDGLTLENMLNLKERHTTMMSKINPRTAIKTKADYFSLSFLRHVNVMEKRYLKTDARFSDTYPWKKTFVQFIDDLMICDSPEKLGMIEAYYKSSLPRWISSPPDGLTIGKQKQSVVSAFDFLLKPHHLGVLHENILALKKYHTTSHHFTYAVQSHIWQCRTIDGQKRYALNIALSVLPPTETDTLVDDILSRKKVQKFFDRPAVGELYEAMQKGAFRRLNHVGIYYDLQEMMARIKNTYLPDLDGMPDIGWGVKYSVRRLGTYRPIGDSITVSPVFDLSEINREMIEFIVYHEMLHKKLGTVHRNGRDYSHTPEFRRLEKKFPNADAIDKNISALFSQPELYLNL